MAGAGGTGEAASAGGCSFLFGVRVGALGVMDWLVGGGERELMPD